MKPTEILAEALAASAVDLGDERAAIDMLCARFPLQVVHAYLEPAIERARELRAGCLTVALA